MVSDDIHCVAHARTGTECVRRVNDSRSRIVRLAGSFRSAKPSSSSQKSAPLVLSRYRCPAGVCACLLSSLLLRGSLARTHSDGADCGIERRFRTRARDTQSHRCVAVSHEFNRRISRPLEVTNGAHVRASPYFLQRGRTIFSLFLHIKLMYIYIYIFFLQ